MSAANSAIETLLTANKNNRVGVVAFSGTQGGGTSNGAAANTLSPLAYYSTNQPNHLYIRNGYLYGRGTTTDRWGQQITMNRDATSSGTNIHAGVVAGARLLMEATNTTINIGGTSVTRLPFLIVMSDGQPSYASDDSNWYDPDLTQQSNNLSNNAGVGFLPALTAAYYKGKLTAAVTYPGEENAAPVFVNRYKADPYLLTLEGTKELTGRKMTEGEFNFVVHDSEGTQVATAKNDADGKLVFSNKVKLPEVGNYTLTVSEVKGTDTTVTYDETKFTVTATVTNNNGVLEAEVKYPEGGIAFVNKYEEPEKPTETTKPAETTKPTEPKAPGAPDTGDHANVLLYGVMAVVSLGAAMAAVIALMNKKRRRS